MEKTRHILAINVGSTSTKVAFYRDSERLVQETLTYSAADLAACKDLRDQLPLREAGLRAFIEKNQIDMGQVDLVISRGGLGRPAPAGAYAIDPAMCEDLMEGRYGKHPSALGPSMALALARRYGMPAVVIDPPSTDEFQPLARVSGLPEIERKSAFHALNQKAAARRAALQMKKRYEEVNLVVAHLGGGITIGAHNRGQVVDCTHGLTEGPFSPERAGALPTQDLLDLAGRVSPKDLSRRLVGQGGPCGLPGDDQCRRRGGGHKEGRREGRGDLPGHGLPDRQGHRRHGGRPGGRCRRGRPDGRPCPFGDADRVGPAAGEIHRARLRFPGRRRDGGHGRGGPADSSRRGNAAGVSVLSCGG